MTFRPEKWLRSRWSLLCEARCGAVRAAARAVDERHHADRERDGPGRDPLTGVRIDVEAGAVRAYGGDADLLDLRHRPFAEPSAVRGEGVEGQRDAVLGGQVVGGAVVGQGVAAVRGGEMGGPGLGLEEHAVGHVVAPSGHRPAQDPQPQSGRRRVCGDRESVGAGAHHHEVVHGISLRFLSVRGGGAVGAVRVAVGKGTDNEPEQHYGHTGVERGRCAEPFTS